MTTAPLFNVQHKVKMGLGEAILRLVHVELKYANGVFDLPDNLRQEREMIVEALNQYELDLGFDCNVDGVPDTVEIFETAATTSCCRIFSGDTSRRKSTVPTVPKINLPGFTTAPVPMVAAPPPVVKAPEPPQQIPTEPTSQPRRRDLSRRR